MLDVERRDDAAIERHEDRGRRRQDDRPGSTKARTSSSQTARTASDAEEAQREARADRSSFEASSGVERPCGCAEHTPRRPRCSSPRGVRGRGRSISSTSWIRPGRGVMTSTRSPRNTASRGRMGDEHDGLAPLEPDALQLDVHGLAGQRVERAERLVHQEERGIVDERAHERDALLHAARQLPRVAVLEALETDEVQELEARAAASARARAAARRPAGARCRARCATGTAPATGTRRRCRGAGRRSACREQRIAVGGRQQAGEDLEEGRFPAAGRADDRHELAVARRRNRCPEAPPEGRCRPRSASTDAGPQWRRRSALPPSLRPRSSARDAIFSSRPGQASV